MKACRYVILLFVISVIGKGGTVPQIFHRVPEKMYYDQFEWLNCVVDPGDYHLISVSVFIKDKIENFYTEYPMQPDDGIFIFKVIPEMVQADSFIYFISAEFSDFTLVAFPADDPKSNPLVIPVVQEKRSAKVIAIKDVSKLFCDLGRDFENVRKVTIYTRYGQTGRFQPEPMNLSKGRFQYTVRETGKKDDKLFYYIVILFTDQTTLSYPSEEFDRNSDYRILNGRRK